MASSTLILLRKWARYGPCADCHATPGDPCIRKIPVRFKVYRTGPDVLTKAHRGRPRSRSRCGNDDRNKTRIGDSFACHLVPDHGGEAHRDWHGHTWEVQYAA